MGTGFAKKKKQAKMMQEKFSKMQDDFKTVEAEGSAGNGLVTVTLTGEYVMKRIQIKPECVDLEDLEGLQDLIKAAHQEAVQKIDGLAKDSGGMDLLNQFPF